MNNLTMTIISILAGIAIATQSSLSGQLSKILGAPLWASFTVYASSAFFTSLTILFFKIQVPHLSTIQSTPKYLWFAGSLLSVLALTTVYSLIPKIGVARVMVGVLMGQLLFSMIASHFGWFELPLTRVTAQKAMGFICMLLGILLINKETLI